MFDPIPKVDWRPWKTPASLPHPRPFRSGVSHSRVTAPRLETFRVENPPLCCGFPTLHRRYAGVDIFLEYQ